MSKQLLTTLVKQNSKIIVPEIKKQELNYNILLGTARGKDLEKVDRAKEYPIINLDYFKNCHFQREKITDETVDFRGRSLKECLTKLEQECEAKYDPQTGETISALAEDLKYVMFGQDFIGQRPMAEEDKELESKSWDNYFEGTYIGEDNVLYKRNNYDTKKDSPVIESLLYNNTHYCSLYATDYEYSPSYQALLAYPLEEWQHTIPAEQAKQIFEAKDMFDHIEIWDMKLYPKLQDRLDSHILNQYHMKAERIAVESKLPQYEKSWDERIVQNQRLGGNDTVTKIEEIFKAYDDYYDFVSATKILFQYTSKRGMGRGETYFLEKQTYWDGENLNSQKIIEETEVLIDPVAVGVNILNGKKTYHYITGWLENVEDLLLDVILKGK